MSKPPVGINLVQPAIAQIVDNCAGDEGDAVPITSAQSELLQSRRDGGDRLFTVGRAAGKDDGIGEWSAVAVAQSVSVDGSRCTTAHIHRHRCTILEVDDGEPSGTLFIRAHSNLDGRPVKTQYGSSATGHGCKNALICTERTKYALAKEHDRRQQSCQPRS